MRLEELSEKEFFTIGDAAKISNVPEYTIRYWEKAFTLIQPLRKPSRHRRYTKDDINNILKIKDLIYKHKMTLDGAKKHMTRFMAIGAKPKNLEEFHTVRDIKFLKEVKETLLQILKE